MENLAAKWLTITIYSALVVNGYVTVSVGWRRVLDHLLRYQGLLGGLATLAGALLIVLQIREGRKKAQIDRDIARRDIQHRHKPEVDALQQILATLDQAPLKGAGFAPGTDLIPEVHDELIEFCRERTTPDIVVALGAYQLAVSTYTQRSLGIDAAVDLVLAPGAHTLSPLWIDATKGKLKTLVMERSFYLHDSYLRDDEQL